jgi:PAS domain S-box-containing protein
MSRDPVAALRASEQTFRLAMDRAPIGMVLTDLRGAWFRVNDAMCALLGRDRDALIGAVMEQVTHPDDAAVSNVAMQRLLAGERDRCEYTKRFLRADGEVVLGQVTVSRVEDPDGEPLYLLAHVVDVTRAHRREAALRTGLEELRQTNERLTHIAGIISHDLRSPLALVQGLVDTVVSRPSGPLDPRDEELLTRARTHTAHLLAGVEALLALARARDAEPTLVEVDLRSTVEVVVEQLSAELEVAGATVRRDGLPNAVTDPALVRILLTNLLSNALKFRRPEVAPVIDIAAGADPEGWWLSVSDNGRGLPEDADPESVFELFTRVGDSVVPGRGIGLATCRQIAQFLGGTIELVRQPVGTRFLVTVPTAPSTTPEHLADGDGR